MVLDLAIDWSGRLPKHLRRLKLNQVPGAKEAEASANGRFLLLENSRSTIAVERIQSLVSHGGGIPRGRHGWRQVDLNIKLEGRCVPRNTNLVAWKTVLHLSRRLHIDG